MSAQDARDHQIDSSWWNYVDDNDDDIDDDVAYFRPVYSSLPDSSQCSTTGVTKVMVYAVLSMGLCI